MQSVPFQALDLSPDARSIEYVPDMGTTTLDYMLSNACQPSHELWMRKRLENQPFFVHMRAHSSLSSDPQEHLL